MILE
ncbi:hypothetical protein ACHAW6_000380 [Cyclotella cf. meneghiniana]|jgi:hypothetical protein